jgi:hypothetical protein
MRASFRLIYAERLQAWPSRPGYAAGCHAPKPRGKAEMHLALRVCPR